MAISKSFKDDLEEMGKIIRNLSSEKKELSSSSLQHSRKLKNLATTLDSKSNTVKNIENKLVDLNDKQKRLSHEMKELFLKKTAYMFRRESGYNLNNRDSIDSYDQIFLSLEREQDKTKILVSKILDVRLSIKKEVHSLNQEVKEIKKLKRKCIQRLRDLKIEIANVNRNFSQKRIKKVELLDTFTNSQSNTVVDLKYTIYDPGTLDVYQSIKTYMFDSNSKKWTQIKPSGIKEIKSPNKLSQINSVMKKYTRALQ